MKNFLFYRFTGGFRQVRPFLDWAWVGVSGCDIFWLGMGGCDHSSLGVGEGEWVHGLNLPKIKRLITF